MVVRRSDDAHYEGHLQDRLYVGNTTFEHGIGKQAIFDRVNHLQCVAGTGAGKFIRHGAFVSGWGGPGGGLFVSPKSAEWADFGLARRSDPALWEHSQGSGRNLGIDSRKPQKQRVHQARYHFRNGRCFLVAPVNHSAWPTSSYNPCADIDFHSEYALSRVLATTGASFPPAPPTSNRDSWYWLTPAGALAAGWGYLNLTDPDPRHHTQAFALRWIMGHDENPERLLPFLPKGKNGKRLPPPPSGSPWMQKLHFSMMAACKQGLNGRIALAGNALQQLGEKNFGTVVSELESKASWLLDPRYEKVVNAPKSDFRLSESVRMKSGPYRSMFPPFRPREKMATLFCGCFMAWRA